MSDDDSDKPATAEIFMLVAGVSTIVFGLSTNLPFIVAPSVLYSSRQTGYVTETELHSCLKDRVPHSCSLTLGISQC